MNIIREVKKIMLRLVGIAMLMLAMLEFGRIEVKAETPNYLTFEAMADGSYVGFYMERRPGAYVQYQKFNGSTWEDWSIPYEFVTADDCVYIGLDRGQKVQFKGRNAKLHFGGTNNFDVESDRELIGYITGTVEVSGDITSLTNEEGNLNNMNSEVGESEYQKLFLGCWGLVSADRLVLPLTKLSSSCYANMFEGCENLTGAPELPATILADDCYNNMFLGCTSLTSAPALPATTLAKNCYFKMFEGCTSLTSAPVLPATILAENCYNNMFLGCTSLTSAPELPATELAEGCYSYMFEGCENLTGAPELPAIGLATDCYSYMFLNCKSMQSAPAILPATDLKDNCYSHMFEGCERLISGPELPATDLAPGCYDKMFLNCKSMQSAPSILPAMRLLSGCYSSMFLGCEALIKAPKLPATKLDNNCYANMFSGCSSLKRAPELPARELKYSCYKGMFENCSSLEKAPNLLNLDMAGTELISEYGEQIPADCCLNMFKGCTALKMVPNITVKSLASACFSGMFENCVNLVDIHCFSIPDLTLEPNCFYGMFKGCSSLELRKDKGEGFEVPWKFKARLGGSVVDFLDAGYFMFTGCDVEGLDFIDNGEDGYSYILEPGATYYFKKYVFDIPIEIFDSETEINVNKGDDNVSEDVKISNNNRFGNVTFKSELPAGTVLVMDKDNFKKHRDMKVHSLDKRNTVNQKWLADYYASQMKKKAKILHTYGIYTGSEIPLAEVGARKVLAWNNLSIKMPGSIYAVCYNQKDGAYLISGTVNEKGTAIFIDFRLHEATNITVFTLE